MLMRFKLIFITATNTLINVDCVMCILRLSQRQINRNKFKLYII